MVAGDVARRFGAESLPILSGKHDGRCRLPLSAEYLAPSFTGICLAPIPVESVSKGPVASDALRHEPGHGDLTMLWTIATKRQKSLAKRPLKAEVFDVAKGWPRAKPRLTCSRAVRLMPSGGVSKGLGIMNELGTTLQRMFRLCASSASSTSSK